MPLTSSISMTTRTSDLDSLRHVNNRAYEQYCSEGRYRLLEELGYPLDGLLEQSITLRPVASFVKFSLQQKAGATLIVRTEAFPLGKGIVLWNHRITQTDGKEVCYVQTKTEFQDHQSPIELLPVTNDRSVQVLIENVPDFSGKCSRVASSYCAMYTDMDMSGNLPVAAMWRIFEEGRHMFGERLGLTLEKLIEFDSHIFWMAGTYQYYKSIQAGQQVNIHTWFERITKIRAYIRQEIRTADGIDLLGASREEHLIVSLSKARPKTMPTELATMLNAYVEYPD